jgi:hypothetical protein
MVGSNAPCQLSFQVCTRNKEIFHDVWLQLYYLLILWLAAMLRVSCLSKYAPGIKKYFTTFGCSSTTYFSMAGSNAPCQLSRPVCTGNKEIFHDIWLQLYYLFILWLAAMLSCHSWYAPGIKKYITTFGCSSTTYLFYGWQQCSVSAVTSGMHPE